MVDKRPPKDRGLKLIEGGGVAPPPPPSPPGPPAAPPRPLSPYQSVMQLSRPVRLFVEHAEFFLNRNNLDFLKFDANQIERIRKFFPPDFKALRQALEKTVHCATDADKARLFLASIVREAWQPGHMNPDVWADWVLEEIADDYEDGYDGFSLTVLAATLDALRKQTFLPKGHEFVAEAKRQRRERFDEILGKLRVLEDLRLHATRIDEPAWSPENMKDEAYDAWREKWGMGPLPDWFGEDSA